MNFERKNIRAMAGYTPGEQPESSDVIKLNTNENPFPPGPAVKKALAAINTDSLRRYPQPTALDLRQALGKLHDIDKDNIVVTNGGDELLRLAINTFVDPGETIAVAEPTYTLYEVLAQAQGCKLKRFKLKEDWSLPDNFASELNAAKARICLLPNPHAPSGTLLTSDTLAALANAFKGVLLIDEAYVDFVDPELGYDCLTLTKQYNNILILRTFSKGYSLAGLRIAYGVGANSLISPMQSKTKDSYNTDFIAQKLALAAVEDQNYAQSSWDFVRDQRLMLSTELNKLGFYCHKSQSNFILVKVPLHKNAEKLYQALKQQGILVRYFKHAGLEDNLRISIGNSDENQRLLSALRNLFADN
tara:strand:- start:1967 stop:3046 length:1080 start_codon:yes stop_codon:yes gene_type:complete